MILFNEYTERAEKFINELPKEIADKIKSGVKQLESDTNIRESDVSLERLCDYIALEYFPKHFDPEQCLKEFTAKLYAASFDEATAFCDFIVSREKLYNGYLYIVSLTGLVFHQRADKNEIFKSSEEKGYTELVQYQRFMGDVMRRLYG